MGINIMKVPEILQNRYIRQFGLFAALTAPIILTSKSCEKMVVNDIKEKVATSDSARYQRVSKETENQNIFVQKVIWARELTSMRDSLKMDSVASKAYFEGAQMVRDSINNAK